MSLDNIKQNQGHMAELLRSDIDKTPKWKEPLKYALSSGKRIRSILTFSLSNNPHYALFIEYIYTAENIRYDIAHSITERRANDAVHIKYGIEMARNIREILLSKAYYNLSFCDNTVFRFIFNYLDLTESLFSDMEKSEREIKQTIIEMSRVKTGNIFTLALILGCIDKFNLENGQVSEISEISQTTENREKLDQIKLIGSKLGMCYQIIKDLQFKLKFKPSHTDRLNFKTYFSHNEIIDLFSENLQDVINGLKRLDMLNPTIREITTYMAKKFSDRFKKLK